jgi:retron-type reverse transcriptase
LEKVKLASVAHGFCKKKSILTNAKYHLEAPNILKIDLKDFFPSISLSRVIWIFKDLGYSNNVSYYLAKICTSNDCLPQGAATSPFLSNIAVRKMDRRLYRLCKKCGLIYTRYADDMTFSGVNIRNSFISIVNKIVEEEGFNVNNKKTQLHKRKGRRIVTGISVNNSEPKISRKIKRDLRQQVHYVLKYGIKSHMYKRKIRDPFYIQSLYGKLQFWKWVEPHDSFLIRNLPQIQAILPKN